MLVEDIADAVLLGPQTAYIFVVGPQRHLVGGLVAGHHHVDTLLVQLVEGHAAADDVKVARVLEIMLVIGIVDNALQVALVVAHTVPIFEDIFHGLITPRPAVLVCRCPAFSPTVLRQFFDSSSTFIEELSKNCL